MSIELSGEIPAGDHRIHIRVAEQGSEDDQLLDPLPLIIQVDEELVQGLIEVTRRSEDATIVSNGDLEMVFRVYNGNNVPVNMNIIPNPPDDWTVLLRSDLSPQSTFLSLSVGPFQEADFTMTVSAPDGLRNNDAVPIPFTIQPSVGNVAATFVESQSVSVLTQCEGIDCLLSEITDPRPNTVLLFAVLAFLGVAWVYLERTSIRERTRISFRSRTGTPSNPQRPYPQQRRISLHLCWMRWRPRRYGMTWRMNSSSSSDGAVACVRTLLHSS